MNEDYRTLSGPGTSEFTDRHSRFLGFAQPVSSEEEALSVLAERRALHPTARHCVYAYRLRSENRTRYSDDGEPQGTAGMPVLDVLQRRELFNCILTVTRYFGGILLGTGGLVHAYSQAASAAAEAAGILLMRRCMRYRITCDYAFYGKFPALLAQFGGGAEPPVYSDQVTADCRIPCSLSADFCKAVTDQSLGAVCPLPLGEEFCA